MWWGEHIHHRVYRIAGALRTGSQVNTLPTRPVRKTPWNSIRKQYKNCNTADVSAMTNSLWRFGLVLGLGSLSPCSDWESAGLGNTSSCTWDVYAAHHWKFQPDEAYRASCFSFHCERVEEKVKHSLLLTFLLYGKLSQRTPDKLRVDVYR